MKPLSFAMLALLLSAGAASAQEVPQAAVEACLRHADAYNKFAPGTAKYNGGAQANVSMGGSGAGDDWRLQVDAPGGVALTCTVSPDGSRLRIQPVGS